MSADQADPGVDETFRFEDLAPVAFVEIDRYCEVCGYNLRTQAIRRDPRTRVLLTRCPECGRYHAATEATTAARVWVRRLSPLLLLAWVMLILSGAVGVFCAAGGISYGTLDELTTRRRAARASQSATQPAGPLVVTTGGRTSRITSASRWTYALQVRPEYPDYSLFMGLVTAGSFGVTLVAALIILVVFHHWRRWICVLVVLAGPLAAAVVVSMVWREEARHLFSWGIGYIGYHMIVQMVGGLTGVVFGRSLARGLVRAFVPPTWRAPLAYLWLVDGRTPPSSASAAETADDRTPSVTLSARRTHRDR